MTKSLSQLQHRCSELEKCLATFVQQEIDYIIINNLGNPEEQHNVKWARRLLPDHSIKNELPTKVRP